MTNKMTNIISLNSILLTKFDKQKEFTITSSFIFGLCIVGRSCLGTAATALATVS